MKSVLPGPAFKKANPKFVLPSYIQRKKLMSDDIIDGFIIIVYSLIIDHHYHSDYWQGYNIARGDLHNVVAVFLCIEEESE